MRIVQLVGLHRMGGEWVTVPPRRYGGIQWVVAHLVSGLAELSQRVFLLAPPGSEEFWRRMERVTVLPYTEYSQAAEWLRENAERYDVVHSHVSWDVHSPYWLLGGAGVWIHTWHVKDNIRRNGQNIPNVVCVSQSQAEATGFSSSPVVRLPVHMRWYPLKEDWDPEAAYLLYMGLLAEWKGIEDAVALARVAGKRLVVAGPKVDNRYDELLNGPYATYMGEVGGVERLELLQGALYTLCLYNNSGGWREPGATIVSESAACGTPVIGYANGCLPELLGDDKVGFIARDVPDAAAKMLTHHFRPAEVRWHALEKWDHMKIVKEYMHLYMDIMEGGGWQ